MEKKQHPGFFIKTACLDRFNLSVTDASILLNFPRPNLSLILNGKRGISAGLAIKLEAVFNISAKQWLEIQLDYDLFIARKKNIKLKRITNKKGTLKKLLMESK